MNILLAAAAILGTQEEKPRIDVVFCIDCSGSMKQVIDGTKAKIWSIVNEIAKAQPAPVLRIGLFGYGDSTRTVHHFDLTEDLDQVYEKLTAVQTENIGNEWVGWALGKAVGEMSWSKEPSALRIIFVTGNETARQGPADQDYPVGARAAIGKDIIVNAIYCGAGKEEELATWRELAKLGEGTYTSVDAGGGMREIATPQDAKLGELNGKLNKTYLAYGGKGKEAQDRQLKQDANAQQAGGAGVLAGRAEAKASALYRTADWDLVEKSKDKAFKLESLKEEELPEEMKKMAPAERQAHVEKMGAERAVLQKEIQEQAVLRQKFIDEEIKKAGADASRAFDQVIQKTIREQAARKKIQFGK